MDDALRNKIKQFCRIDYDDDDELIDFFVSAVDEELSDLIPDYTPENRTKRQELIVCVYAKSLYDTRELTQTIDRDKMRLVLSSMLGNERYKKEWEVSNGA